MQSTKTQKKEVKELKKIEKAVKHITKAPHRETTRSKSALQPYVIKKPQEAIGSKKRYGSPYNALNHTLEKFTPTARQAALMAWIHGVANPWNPDPHPVPVAAVPGSSPSEARMFTCTLRGTALANADGNFFITACVDGWTPATIQEMGTGTGIGIDTAVPALASKYLCYGGSSVYSAPLNYTNASWPSGYGFPAWNMFSQGYPIGGNPMPGGAGSQQAGIYACSLPPNFVPNLSSDTRYTCVSAGLRLRPEGAAYKGAGDIAVFNWRRQPIRGQFPTAFTGSAAVTMGALLAIPEKILSRERQACANWPSNKWLSAAAVPNTQTCLGQWFPVGGTSSGGSSYANCYVGFPHIFACGKGLDPGTPVEFEYTMNYAVYALTDYQSSTSERSDVMLPMADVEMVAHSGVGPSLVPKLLPPNKQDHSGIAAAMSVEQEAGRAPRGPNAGKAIVEGIKTAGAIFEEVTGTSVLDTILEGAGILASLL